MSKKKKNKETTIENYYDLKVDKIDELVAALKADGKSEEADGGVANEQPVPTNIAEITGEEEKKGGSKKSKHFDPYRHNFLAWVPPCVKAIFIKWWFAGAVCFFIMWGIGLKDIDAVLLVGVVLGVIVDVLVNPIFRMMESDRKEYNNFMMFPFPFKAFWTFFTNIIYYVVIALMINFCYFGVNQLLNLIYGTLQEEYHIYVAVEPLLFGVFCTVADMAFIGIKDLIVYLVKRNKKNKQEGIADV